MSFLTSENTNRIASIAKTTVTQADSYPYSIDIGTPAVGFGAMNADTATTLVFSLLTKTNETIGPFYVPAGASLSEEVPPFSQIDVTTATTAFYIVIRGTLEG